PSVASAGTTGCGFPTPSRTPCAAAKETTRPLGPCPPMAAVGHLSPCPLRREAASTNPLASSLLLVLLLFQHPGRRRHRPLELQRRRPAASRAIAVGARAPRRASYHRR
ncbi:unnamed protein product, partial [Ectocarpus sp. 12 AP-2014]